jgi:hypothetical protein
MFQFGFETEEASLLLSKSGDFFMTWRTSDASAWPDGASIVIKVGGQEWAATIVDDVASWYQPNSDVQALNPPTAHTFKLIYTGGGKTIEWFNGEVVWQ